MCLELFKPCHAVGVPLFYETLRQILTQSDENRKIMIIVVGEFGEIVVVFEVLELLLTICQMSTKDKFGLGYGNQIHEGVLSYEKEVLESVFDSRMIHKKALKNKGIVDSGCSRHITGNKAYLVEYQDYNGGPIAFGGSKGHITGKGKIMIRKLDFEDAYFVKELK
ncbi:hypothetical protein Tco_0340936 [Tanacetum coccineum]